MLPLPALSMIPDVKGLQEVLAPIMSGTQEIVRGGVMSYGEAAAYALVWEFGNARQTKEGPKTTLGITPDGEQVWLSIQAPSGYIRIHDAEFREILTEELGRVLIFSTNLRKELEDASYRAARRIAPLIESTAPVDEGKLVASVLALYANDPDLATDAGIGIGDNL